MYMLYYMVLFIWQLQQILALYFRKHSVVKGASNEQKYISHAQH